MNFWSAVGVPGAPFGFSVRFFRGWFGPLRCFAFILNPFRDDIPYQLAVDVCLRHIQQPHKLGLCGFVRKDHDGKELQIFPFGVDCDVLVLELRPVLHEVGVAVLFRTLALLRFGISNLLLHLLDCLNRFLLGLAQRDFVLWQHHLQIKRFEAAVAEVHLGGFA